MSSLRDSRICSTHLVLPCRAFTFRRYAAGVLVVLAPLGFNGSSHAHTKAHVFYCLCPARLKARVLSKLLVRRVWIKRRPESDVTAVEAPHARIKSFRLRSNPRRLELSAPIPCLNSSPPKISIHCRKLGPSLAQRCGLTSS